MTAVQAPYGPASAMEDIHGVDVSWLHQTTKDHQYRQQAPAPPAPSEEVTPKSLLQDVPAEPVHHEPQNAQRAQLVLSAQKPASLPLTSVTMPPAQKTPPKRPTFITRNSSEKSATLTTPDAKGGHRRNSWMNSISSKFSSQNPPAQTTHAQAQGSPAVVSGNSSHTPSANGALNGIQAASAGTGGGCEPYVPQQPTKGSFIGNAFRRLSSGTQSGASTKVYPNGGVCPRRVMNVDRNRARCLVPELEDSKLRKVAFCVDVEIAGGPRYRDETDADEKQKKKDDEKLKEQGKGEALKHVGAVAEEKEKNGIVAVSHEAVGNESDSSPAGTVIAKDKQETSKKKEKKKRSEVERKERKEKKRKKAEENGTVPLEFTRGSVDRFPDAASNVSGSAVPRIQDRPTVDPLRIYRRCCQLRESPILKRISDQLSAPKACASAQPGVVTYLDLTGSRLQMADVLTLSDWLAIVPVKKLSLEDADMNDEKVRVILAGLLAARAPYPSWKRSPSSKTWTAEDLPIGPTVVKKLILKNNPKITSAGWKHIALFIYMCRSIIALDVSMIPFPKSPPALEPVSTTDSQSSIPSKRIKSRDMAEILSKAISERLGGSGLQELVLAECGLTASIVRKIIDGSITSGIQRLSLAGNDLDDEGLEYVQHYIKSGVCRGIDLGGNDLRSWIGTLCETLNQGTKSPMWALCLSNTGLTPELLKILLPSLVNLPAFRFLDLSHNKELFSGETSLCLIRKYMPQMKELKRIHLMNVDLKPEDAIAISEILPDCPTFAHINILENPLISRVANSTDEETQEEAAALYASLTIAAKLSHTLICVDVDVPAPEMGEVVKALAKQVVAYCLRNIESINEVPELQTAPRQVEVPHILMHLVGAEDTYCKDGDNSPSAPDDDYIVGGTGIAKALDYCLLHKASDLRRLSLPISGSNSPRNSDVDPEQPGKARAMSKNLLETARNTRARIQPALVREAKAGNDVIYRRLLFLDQTLEGMIQRFEDEYPETRLTRSDTTSTQSSHRSNSPLASTVPTLNTSVTDATILESDDDEPHTIQSRHNSDVSLANRYMSQEEGRLHRFGHRVRTGLLNPARPTSEHGDGENQPGFISGTMDDQGLPEHLRSLREYFMNFSGDEMKEMIEGVGWEKAFDSVVENAEELRNLERDDPAAFKLFRDSQITTLKNKNPNWTEPNSLETSKNSHQLGGSKAERELEKTKSNDDCAIED